MESEAPISVSPRSLGLTISGNEGDEESGSAAEEERKHAYSQSHHSQGDRTSHSSPRRSDNNAESPASFIPDNTIADALPPEASRPLSDSDAPQGSDSTTPKRCSVTLLAPPPFKHFTDNDDLMDRTNETSLFTKKSTFGTDKAISGVCMRKVEPTNLKLANNDDKFSEFGAESGKIFQFGGITDRAFYDSHTYYRLVKQKDNIRCCGIFFCAVAVVFILFLLLSFAEPQFIVSLLFLTLLVPVALSVFLLTSKTHYIITSAWHYLLLFVLFLTLFLLTLSTCIMSGVFFGKSLRSSERLFKTDRKWSSFEPIEPPPAKAVTTPENMETWNGVNDLILERYNYTSPDMNPDSRYITTGINYKKLRNIGMPTQLPIVPENIDRIRQKFAYSFHEYGLFCYYTKLDSLLFVKWRGGNNNIPLDCDACVRTNRYNSVEVVPNPDEKDDEQIAMTYDICMYYLVFTSSVLCRFYTVIIISFDNGIIFILSLILFMSALVICFLNLSGYLNFSKALKIYGVKEGIPDQLFDFGTKEHLEDEEGFFHDQEDDRSSTDNESCRISTEYEHSVVSSKDRYGSITSTLLNPRTPDRSSINNSVADLS